MTVSVALQLYTVREALQRDYEGVVRKVAAMGYIGVETAGFPGTTPQAAGRLFRELDLVVPSIHKFPVPRREHKAEIMDILGALDCKVVVSGGGKDHFNSVESIRRISDQFNEAHAMFAGDGIRIGVHNHWWEYLKVGDRYAVDILLDTLTPEVFLQIDTYWVKTAGVDPEGVVKRFGKRAPLLHIKDGPAVQDQPMVALGEGVMDIPAIVAAGQGFTEWIIVELDRCDTDMVEAAERSYQYLVKNGLASGREVKI